MIYFSILFWKILQKVGNTEDVREINYASKNSLLKYANT